MCMYWELARILLYLHTRCIFKREEDMLGVRKRWEGTDHLPSESLPPWGPARSGGELYPP